MKKIILIFVAFLLLGACSTEIEEQNIVTIVAMSKSPDHSKKYKVTLNYLHVGEYFYTDSLYQVGDTLCLTLKK